MDTFGHQCYLLTGIHNIYSGHLCNVCLKNLMRLTTPILLDGYEAIKSFSNMRAYCPWCLDELQHLFLHDIPVICTECLPKYAAEYDVAVIKYWLMDSLYIPDIARAIMSLMISFFCCIARDPTPYKFMEPNKK